MAVVTAAGPVTAAADECCLRSLAPHRLREGAAVPNGTLREGVVPTSWHRSECVLGVRTGCGRCGRHERGCARLPPSQVNSAASRPAPASDTIGIVRCSASRLSRSRRYVTRPCRLLGMGAQRIAAFSLRGSRCSLWRRGSVTIVCALLVGSSSRAPSLGASLASVFGLGGVHHKTTTGKWVPQELKSRFSRGPVRSAKRGAGTRQKSPADVLDVGAVVSSSSRRKAGLTPASATVATTAGVGASASASATVGTTAVVGAPEVRFQQGDKDDCVAYPATSAVHFVATGRQRSRTISLQPRSTNSPRVQPEACTAPSHPLCFQ